MLVKQLLGETTLPSADSQLTPRFNASFDRLEQRHKNMCHNKYRRWRKDPQSLNFEPKFAGHFGVHIDYGTHAVCRRNGNTVTWLFVGGYNAYERELDEMRAALRRR